LQRQHINQLFSQIGSNLGGPPIECCGVLWIVKVCLGAVAVLMFMAVLVARVVSVLVPVIAFAIVFVLLAVFVFVFVCHCFFNSSIGLAGR